MDRYQKKKQRRKEREKIKEAVEKLEKKGELDLKWKQPQQEFVRKESRTYTSEDVEKKKRTEKFPLISQKQIKKMPWKPLNITKQQWNKLKPNTKKKLKRHLYEELDKQIQRGVKKRINKPQEEMKLEDVEKVLKELIGENVSSATVLSVASRLGVTEASSKIWKRSMQKYVDIAEGAETIEEVRKKLEEAGRNVSQNTILKVASDIGIKEATAKSWDKSKQEYVDIAEGAETIEEVRKKLEEAGRDVSQNTILLVASSLGVTEASSKIWKRGMQKYVDIAEGAETIEEVRKKLEEAGKNLSERTVLNIASRMGIPEASSKMWEKGTQIIKERNTEENVKVVEEVLKGGASLQEIKTYLPVVEEVIKRATSNYVKRLKNSLSEGKIKNILKKKGFNEKEIDEIMEKGKHE